MIPDISSFFFASMIATLGLSLQPTLGGLILILIYYSSKRLLTYNTHSLDIYRRFFNIQNIFYF